MITNSLVLLRAKQPLLDWLNSLPDAELFECELAEIQADPSSYLTPDFEEPEELTEYLKEHAEELFEQELSEWALAEELWPAKRDYAALCEFFEIITSNSVYDMEEAPDNADVPDNADKPQLN